jgi:hypothetical protein
MAGVTRTKHYRLVGAAWTRWKRGQDLIKTILWVIRRHLREDSALVGNRN